MKLSISAEMDLTTPGTETACATWLDVRLWSEDRLHGSARAALVHVGEIADAHGDLWPALQGTNLEALHDVYFSQGWYKDEFADGAGIDLLFIERVDPSLRDRNQDLALVRRLANTIGSGCQLVVVRYESPLDAVHWSRMGFAVTTAGRSAGLMHLKLGYRHAQLIDDGSGDLQVQASNAPSGNVPN